MRYFPYIRKSTDDDEHQVLSLESQEREVLARFGAEPGMELLPKIEESLSAKRPGRPLFNDMLDRIERGEADGIVAWDPDRLARNTIDGGRIVYLLDTGKLKDLKFCTYTFENSPQGKYMLQISFANAKYHVDALSINVKRGNRTKVQNGWRPNMAPIGYLNVGARKATTIAPDPERFPLVKRLWEFALTGAYTVPQLLDIATNEWGLRTVKRKRIGGKPLTVSSLYRLLENPFYAGILRHEDKDYPGKHPAMVTLTDFMSVQRMLGRDDVPRPIRHTWDYTGLMKCPCGRSVTAEHKRNRFGSEYIYYHCTRRRAGDRCSEPYVEHRNLEAQMGNFLEEITLSPKRHAWAIRHALQSAEDVGKTLQAQSAALTRAHLETETALKNLRYLRTRDQITEAEFLADRDDLLREQARVRQELERLSPENCIEPERAFILLNVRALEWFDRGDGAMRRLLLESMGSNPTLEGGNLKIDAAFPFRRYDRKREIRELCTACNDVRTHPQPAAFGKLIHLVRMLTEKFGGSELFREVMSFRNDKPFTDDSR
jgi:site-specific DNA recombinase